MEDGMHAPSSIFVKRSVPKFGPRSRAASQTDTSHVHTFLSREDVDKGKPLTSLKPPAAGDSDLSTSTMGIDCTLKTESIHREHSYTALSYTWGEEAPSATTRVNSQPSLVHQNLELALRHILKPAHSTNIWIDSICINQEDEQRRIFERVIEVFGLLGPARVDSDITMKKFENIRKKAIEAGIQDFRASTDGWDNEDPLSAIDSMPPYEVDIEKSGKYGGDDDSLSEMISSSPAKDISVCLHQLRPPHIGEVIENIADHEVVASDSDRDNDVKISGDSCGGLDQAHEVIGSKSDRPIRASSSYTDVSALLLAWNDDCQDAQNEISELKTVLEKFNFHVEELAERRIPSRIPSQSSTQELQKRFCEFLDLHRSEASLVIIYYGGHSKVSDISDLEKNDVEKRRENGHSHIGSWDSLPTLEDPDIEKRGQPVFSSYRLGNPVSEDAPLGERLDIWTRIKAHCSQLQTWIHPSSTFGTMNSRDKSPGWALVYDRSHPWRDTDTGPQYFSRIDRICLGLNQIVCPPLVWILLRSLRLEPPSLLDQKLQRLIPFASNAIVSLEVYPRTALVLVLHLLSLSVVAILKPAASMIGRTNLYVFPCWILSLTCGILSWSLMGGSLLEFCLLFVPFALSVGLTLGLLIEHLWQLRLGKQPRGFRRHHLVLASDSDEKM